jgi:integrase
VNFPEQEMTATMQLDIFDSLSEPTSAFAEVGEIPNLPAVYVEPARQLPSTLLDALQGAADLADASRAESTRRSYSIDWKIFQSWCDLHGLCPLPAAAGTVAAFIADQVRLGKKPATLGRRLSSIKYHHKIAEEPSPTDDPKVKAVMGGARRTLGAAPRRMAPLLTDALKDITRLIPNDAKGLRDKALLLVCWSGALRRSDLVQMDMEHITFTSEGATLLIPRSKTDQTGEGQTIALIRARNPLYCPINALQEWLAAAKITSGPIWVRVRRGGHPTTSRLSGESVRKLTKQYVGKVGLNPALFGAHSLRSGPLSAGAAVGASIAKLKQLSRHKSTDVLVNNYIHPVDIFRDHCLANLL